MKKYKIFEGNNLQEDMDKCLEEGYFPITDLKKAWDMKQKLSPHKWIDTGVVFQEGVIRKLTMEEAKDLKKLYENKGRLLFVGSYGILVGYSDLYYGGRFLGVRNKVKRSGKQ